MFGEMLTANATATFPNVRSVRGPKMEMAPMPRPAKVMGQTTKYVDIFSLFFSSSFFFVVFGHFLWIYATFFMKLPFVRHSEPLRIPQIVFSGKTKENQFEEDAKQSQRKRIRVAAVVVLHIHMYTYLT